MKKQQKNQIDLLPLFKDFITANLRNKRKLSGGKKLSLGTKNNYEYLFQLLQKFSDEKGFELRVRGFKNNKRHIEQERRYYKKFYTKFTEYLYKDLKHFDNYVGHNIKMLKAFFKWLNTSSNVFVGDYYKEFYVWKEEIPILALEEYQLQFLLFNREFENSLKPHLKKTKDLFVFGCTVGLRVSDLLALKKENVQEFNGSYYLKVYSKKTTTYTKIKLPSYAVEIIRRNKTRGNLIFKSGTYRNFNSNIKKVAEQAGWTFDYPKIRSRQGKPVTVYKDSKSRSHYRFCDLISTHTMRRTAITTMLNLGVDEQTVRKISGHAPGSVEFYKYVKYNQKLIDQETDIMFEKLQKNSPFEVV